MCDQNRNVFVEVRLRAPCLCSRGERGRWWWGRGVGGHWCRVRIIECRAFVQFVCKNSHVWMASATHKPRGGSAAGEGGSAQIASQKQPRPKGKNKGSNQAEIRTSAFYPQEKTNKSTSQIANDADKLAQRDFNRAGRARIHCELGCAI